MKCVPLFLWQKLSHLAHSIRSPHFCSWQSCNTIRVVIDNLSKWLQICQNMAKPTSTNRVLKELENIRKNPLDFCSAGPINDADIFRWQATLMGPPNTPFEGGVFALTIEIGEKYPFEAPKVHFNTPIYHPNITEEGKICIEILSNPDKWSPTLSLSQILASIYNLLGNPNTGHSLRPDVAKIYDTNIGQFLETAREWTQKHAMNWALCLFLQIKPYVH